ncbi:MAG: ATP-binding protein [Cystobacter sp.]
MTIRARILWIAATAVLLVCLMGLLLYSGARRGQLLRHQLGSGQSRVDQLERLHATAWPFVNELAQARQEGNDPGLALQRMTERVEAEMGSDRGEPPSEVREAVLAWLTLAERRVRQLSPHVPMVPEVEWLLYSEFEQTVGRRIQWEQQQERERMRSLQRQLEENVSRSKWAALFIPALGLLFMGVVASALLAPLRRSLLGLTETAERIGRGDFDVHTFIRTQDELGMLSSAIDRMARELRESLEEKQRMIRAEAELAEREALRYQALLEDTVHARTAELAQANTRLRDSLQQLESTQEQLLAADRLASVGRLAAGVGHEINNPLAYILSNLRYVHEELGGGAEPGEEARQEMLEALAEASEGAERVRLIVQDLKTLARPDEVALGPVNVAAVVRSSAKMARHETRDKARLVEECEGVPPVHANAARLGQVFLNLIINAAHAIPPGRMEVHVIHVRAHMSAPHLVTVEVRDTGAGISPEHLRRVFDPFFTTKPVGLGTGLGLSVCHRIITSLGGDIRVESELGRGTCFFITLPVADESRGSAPPSAA